VTKQGRSKGTHVLTVANPFMKPQVPAVPYGSQLNLYVQVSVFCKLEISLNHFHVSCYPPQNCYVYAYSLSPIQQLTLSKQVV
jgi:hypothetical protein